MIDLTARPTSLLLALALAALAGCRTPDPSTTATGLETPTAADAAGTGDAAASRLPRFEVVDPASIGLDFVLDSGARGEKLLPETMGGGLAFLDLDGDDAPELLFVDTVGSPRLYRNRGDGTFDDVTASSGLGAVSIDPEAVAGPRYGMGVAVGDVDGDGLRDLFLTCVGPDRLLRARRDPASREIQYDDITAQAGVGGGDRWSTGAAFVDLDRDGTLDLVVGRYVRWSREIDLAQNFARAGEGRVYRPPFSFPGERLSVYRGLGNGRFEEISQGQLESESDPPSEAEMKTLAVLPIDADHDGDIDLFIANDTTPNQLLRNDSEPGTIRLEPFGPSAGVGYGPGGLDTGAMGVDFFRSLGERPSETELAIGVGNFAREPSSFFVARGGAPLFEDRAAARGLAGPTRDALTFGLLFFDADHDGDLDLFQANGHIEPDIERFDTAQRWAQPAQLFTQAASGRFTLAPTPLGEPMVGRGAAVADLEGDGDLDLVITPLDGPPRILRNLTVSGPSTATDPAWLRLRLHDDRPGARDRDAIGARVRVRRGELLLERTVEPARSYLSAVDPTLHFGFPCCDGPIDEVEVLWPDGERLVLGEGALPPLGQLTVLRRTQGDAE